MRVLFTESKSCRLCPSQPSPDTEPQHGYWRYGSLGVGGHAIQHSVFIWIPVANFGENNSVILPLKRGRNEYLPWFLARVCKHRSWVLPLQSRIPCILIKYWQELYLSYLDLVETRSLRSCSEQNLPPTPHTPESLTNHQCKETALKYIKSNPYSSAKFLKLLNPKSLL